jgi:hypothetical protein
VQLVSEKEEKHWKGNMTVTNTKFTLSLAVATFVAAIMFAGEVKAQSNKESQPEVAAPLEPLRQGIGENQLFAELDTRNELRKSALLDYTVHRTYQVADLKGKVHAEEIGQMEFHAPDQKNFVATSETGSGLIRRMALNPLISSEIEAAAGKVHHDSAISPANYSLELLGEQQLGAHRCFVAKAVPKRKEKYLFVGKVWIDADDYGIVRIEGHPAKKLSFWIERADFVRQYQKIDGFWLPEKDQTLVQVRLYGKKVLTIEHQNYVLNASQSSTDQSPGRRPLLPEARVPASADGN